MIKRKKCFQLFLLFVLLAFCFACAAAENKPLESNSVSAKTDSGEKVAPNKIQKNLRIALCHLDVSQEP